MIIDVHSIEELQRRIRAHERVRLRGGGTKSTPAEDDALVLDLRALSGIVEYVPEECVFTARAGTPLREIAAALAAHGQYLPFDPPFADEGATIGGTVASGMSGPGRYRYGGVRDFLIGVRVVDGEARVIRSGGKVVKNAAGFLLHHGMVGSLGMFGAIAEVTFKVFPAPRTHRTVTIDCGSVPAAFARAREIEAERREYERIDFDHRGILTVVSPGMSGAQGASGGSGESGAAGASGASKAAGAVGPPGGADGVARSVVKVPGAMTRWEALERHVTAAQFMCAGSVAWLWTDDAQALARALEDVRLAGLIFRGRGAGRRIGFVPHNEFEARVRRVMDPAGRFAGVEARTTEATGHDLIGRG